MWTDIKPGSRVRVSSNDFYDGAIGTVSTDRKINEETFHYVVFDHPVVMSDISHIVGLFASSELNILEGKTCLN